MAIKPTRFGLSCAITTPMNAHGAVNLSALVRHARWTLDNGCDSVTLFGTTGEGAALTMREREAMLGAVIGSGIVPEKQLLAGIASTALGEAVDQAEMALEAGCRGLLVLPPYYFKGVDDDGLFAWHSAFIDRLKGKARGIILYHIPSQSSVSLSVALVGRLKTAYPGIVTGVKDSSGNWDTQEAFLKAHGELAILVGDERQLARSVREGGEGSICGFSNFAPALLRPLIYQGLEDPRVNALVDTIVSMPVMSAVKVLAAHVHGAGAEFTGMRAPLPQLTAADAARVIAAFEAVMKQKAA